MKAWLDVYGLGVELSADHPVLFDAVMEDLRPFRVRARPSARRCVRLQLTALPAPFETDHYPKPFAPYREIGSRARLAGTTTVTRYATSALTVISDPRRPLIRAGLLPELARQADPAYHYCFTQPVSPWLKRRGLYFLHAGCVARGPEGILIAGPSRAGKSTLALCAVRAGFKFLSDEQPLLSLRDGQVLAHSFPRRIRLDSDVARLFPEIKRLGTSLGSGRIAFPIARFWPGCIASSCRPRILLFPEFRTRGRLKLSRMAASDSLSRLLQDDHFIWYKGRGWNRLSQRHLALLRRLVVQAAAFRLAYHTRDLPRIPPLLDRLLKHG